MSSKKQNLNEGDLPWDQLSAPACRALASAGYTRLEQLTGLNEKQFELLHGVGPKAIRTLRAALAARSLSFRDSA